MVSWFDHQYIHHIFYFFFQWTDKQETSGAISAVPKFRRGKPAAAPLRRRLGRRFRHRDRAVHGMGKSAGSLQGRDTETPHYGPNFVRETHGPIDCQVPIPSKRNISRI